MAHGQATIQHLLGGLLKNKQLLASMRRAMVMSLWKQVVGEIVAQKSWPERISDGLLVVGVSSHPWAAELHTLRPQILARYRQLLGRSAVKDIEFRVSRRRGRQRDESRRAIALYPAPDDKLAEKPVPTRLLAGVHNPEVKSLLGPAFSKLRAAREWKREQGWVRCPRCQRVYHGDACPHCSDDRDAA